MFPTLDDEAEMRSVLERRSSGGRVLFPADGTFGMVGDGSGASDGHARGRLNDVAA